MLFKLSQKVNPITRDPSAATTRGRAYGVTEQEQTAVNGGPCRRLRQCVQDVNQYVLVKFNVRYCAKLLAAGWEFAGSVINVVRCPCCPRDAQVDQKRAEIKAALVELFDDDEDGLAATFEDHRLWKEDVNE